MSFQKERTSRLALTSYLKILATLILSICLFGALTYAVNLGCTSLKVIIAVGFLWAALVVLLEIRHLKIFINESRRQDSPATKSLWQYFFANAWDVWIVVLPTLLLSFRASVSMLSHVVGLIVGIIVAIIIFHLSEGKNKTNID